MMRQAIPHTFHRLKHENDEPLNGHSFDKLSMALTLHLRAKAKANLASDDIRRRIKMAGNLGKKSGRYKRIPKASAAFLTMSSLLTPVSYGNVVGADTQNFNPTTSGLDFVTVHSSETLDPGIINFGFYLNNAVNTLPYFESSEGDHVNYSDSLLSADINVGIGVVPGLDLGISIPQVLRQNVSGDGFRGQFAQNGNTELRVNAKYQLWGTNDYGIAIVGSTNFNRIKNNPFLGENAGATNNLEFVADTTISNVAMAINIGHRWRKKGSIIENAAPIVPIGNQYIGSAAISYLFSSIDTKIIAEMFGSKPVENETENSDRLASSAEALIGLKHDFTTNLAGHFGGGSELLQGRSSPDWRIYAGLNYAMGPTYSPRKPTTEAPKTTVIKVDPFAGPVKPREKIVIHDILFEFDSDHLVVGKGSDNLAKLVDYLLKKPTFSKLIIDGHTDSIGPEAYNKNLSQRRAETIRGLLITRFKLDPKKIEARGNGESKPIADNGNYQGRQLNRRVEFTIFRNGLK